MKSKVPDFLYDLLEARSPSGFEFEAQTVVDDHLSAIADKYWKDTMGSRFASLGEHPKSHVMLSGHMDEIGLMVSAIDKKGFLYIETIGGHDFRVISGRAVTILGKNGPVSGVTGRMAVHLQTPEERKAAVKREDLWIDIGATSKEDAEQHVSIGDPIVYAQSPTLLQNNLVAARAHDDKTGAYAVCEVIKRLATNKDQLNTRVTAVASTQEEVGLRGAITSAYALNPSVAIAVDVGHANDHPKSKPLQFGQHELGKGAIISRGCNVNPVLYNHLIQVAEDNKIPYQVEAAPRPTGTDGRAIQMARSGVPTSVLSIPLRYMHSPCEVINLDDVEHTVVWIQKFIESLNGDESWEW